MDILLGLMLGSEMNAGLDAGPIQKMFDAGSVPSPDFLEILTSLIGRLYLVGYLWVIHSLDLRF